MFYEDSPSSCLSCGVVWGFVVGGGSGVCVCQHNFFCSTLIPKGVSPACLASLNVTFHLTSKCYCCSSTSSLSSSLFFSSSSSSYFGASTIHIRPLENSAWVDWSSGHQPVVHGPPAVCEVWKVDNCWIGQHQISPSLGIYRPQVLALAWNHRCSWSSLNLSPFIRHFSFSLPFGHPSV